VRTYSVRCLHIKSNLYIRPTRISHSWLSKIIPGSTSAQFASDLHRHCSSSAQACSRSARACLGPIRLAEPLIKLASGYSCSQYGPSNHLDTHVLLAWRLWTYATKGPSLGPPTRLGRLRLLTIYLVLLKSRFWVLPCLHAASAGNLGQSLRGGLGSLVPDPLKDYVEPTYFPYTNI
jgi:hypothetical protein